MGFIDKILNPFGKNKNTTKKYKDISKESQRVAPDTPSELLLFCRDIAGNQIQEKISQSDDLHWIRAEYTYPSFDSMNFMYKNLIFSVIIDIQDKYGKSYLPEIFIKRQLYACKTYNLIPCKYPIIVPNPTEPEPDKIKPKTQGWNLFNTETDKEIIPEDFNTNDLIELSDWEMRNFGIRFISRYLSAKKIKLLSFQDTLEVDPQIWFEDENGKKCWIIVRCEHTEEIKKPKKLNEIIRRCFKYDGYFAGIIIEPKNKDIKTLYRCQDIRITFNGLEKIHSTI